MIFSQNIQGVYLKFLDQSISEIRHFLGRYIHASKYESFTVSKGKHENPIRFQDYSYFILQTDLCFSWHILILRKKGRNFYLGYLFVFLRFIKHRFKKIFEKELISGFSNDEQFRIIHNLPISSYLAVRLN